MSSKSFSVTSFTKQIIDKLDIKNTNKLMVYLDSKIYPNEFGISVRPLQVRSGNTIIDMKQLIDLFDKIPYITVKETRYRSVYRDPMLMTIDLIPKQYKPKGSTEQCPTQDTTYYDYYIDKLCLRSEIKKYLLIEKQSHEVIKEFKQSLSNDNCVESFRNAIDDSPE